MDNSRQEGRKIDVRVNMNLEKSTGLVNLSLNKLCSNTVEANYIMASFLYEASKGEGLTLKLLKTGDDLLKGDHFTLHEEVPPNIIDEIKFLSFLLDVERRQTLKFSLPSKIPDEDLESFYRISEILNKGSVKSKYIDLVVTVNDPDSLRNVIKVDDSTEDSYALTCIQRDQPSIHLFDVDIQFKSLEIEYRGLRISNKERLNGVLDFMEVGEVAKVKYEPVDNTSNIVEERWEVY